MFQQDSISFIVTEITTSRNIIVISIYIIFYARIVIVTCFLLCAMCQHRDTNKNGQHRLVALCRREGTSGWTGEKENVVIFNFVQLY